MKIIIDCNNICYAALHTMGDLSFNEKKTGIIFGFLNQILSLANKFECSNFIFCWDSRKSYRKFIYPEYKANRKKDLTPEEAKDLKIGFQQFTELRIDVLPRMGFSNVYMQTGYEADDFMAAYFYKSKDELVVVSTDEDMYQILGPKVQLYNQRTKKIKTWAWFTNEYDISPKTWVDVKAIAGCSSDNVKGIVGVGEKTAVKYLRNELKHESKKYRDIIDGKEIIERNKPVVNLPFTKGKLPLVMKEKKDQFSKEKFIDVFVDYDFQSFLKKDKLDKWCEVFGI